MTTTHLRRLDGSTVAFTQTALESATGAPAILPGAPDYDASRALWNAMIDRRPGAILRVETETQVAAAVGFALDQGLMLAVRAGGHNIAGKASCDGGLVIDLRAMTAVTVDPDERLARVGAGATLAMVDAATQAHGLTVPTGINSTTGIAGLTLGGGFGWTTRSLGLTIDSLRAARVVTANGAVVTASATENPELFWGLRGGGGNFGIVTEFTFALHPLGPEVYAGMILHDAAHAASVLTDYGQLMPQAPEALSCWAVLRKAPPLPFLDPTWHGREVLVLAVCYVGSPEHGPQATAALTGLGSPIATALDRMPFTAWQQAFDPLQGEGARNYWKSHDLASLTPDAIQRMADGVYTLPTEECEIFIGQIDGAASRPALAETAWSNRAPHFVVNIHTRWQDPAADTVCVGWARGLYDALTPHAMGSRYVNFIPDGDDAETASAYGPHLDRLRALKGRLDPANLFRTNFNVAGR